jgi:hypothetical protein
MHLVRGALTPGGHSTILSRPTKIRRPRQAITGHTVLTSHVLPQARRQDPGQRGGARLGGDARGKTQRGASVRLVLWGWCTARFRRVAGDTMLAVPRGGIEGCLGSPDQRLGGGQTVLWQASTPEPGSDLSGLAEGAIGQRLADALGVT